MSQTLQIPVGQSLCEHYWILNLCEHFITMLMSNEHSLCTSFIPISAFSSNSSFKTVSCLFPATLSGSFSIIATKARSWSRRLRDLAWSDPTAFYCSRSSILLHLFYIAADLFDYLDSQLRFVKSLPHYCFYERNSMHQWPPSCTWCSETCGCSDWCRANFNVNSFKPSAIFKSVMKTDFRARLVKAGS